MSLLNWMRKTDRGEWFIIAGILATFAMAACKTGGGGAAAPGSGSGSGGRGGGGGGGGSGWGVSAFAINPAVNSIFADSFPYDPSLTDIDGFNDGQRLPGNGANNYGPEAHFYTVPRPRTADELAEWDGALVGLIDVGAPTGPMPPDYVRLNITRPNRVYCVFLRKTPAEVQGWVTDVSGQACTAPSHGSMLQAVTYQLPGGGTDEDYPLGTRFTESRNGPNGMVVLGMKCLAGWCEIGRGLTYKQANNPNSNVQQQVKGWHDEQELAAPAGGAPGAPLIRTDSSSIVPVPGLASITFAQYQLALQNVATIYMKDDPKAGSKQAKWGLRRGVNYVWLTLTSTTTGRAQFTQTPVMPTSGPSFVVHRMPHTGLVTRIPGVARWVWRDSDEEAWIDCDQGCCTIGAT